MANKNFVIQYLIKAKDGFSSQARKAARAFGDLDSKSKGAAKNFKTTSRTFVGGFKSMAAAAISFFGIKQFFTVGARFQDALADLSAITGATGKDLKTLQSDIFRLGKQSSTSADQVAEAFKLVASAKPELLENLDALTATTEQVLLLKNAAGIELADAANIAAQGLNIFGAGADQANRFVNVLAAGAKLGSSEIRDTGEAMLLAGPAARAAGLSFEQLNAAIQTVAKGGIKGSRAGTALNSIFGRLQRQGLDFQKLGLQGTFELLGKKMDALPSSTHRALFASKLFGEEHSKVGFALLANAKFLGQYEKSLAGTNIAEEQAALRLATFNAKMRKLGVIISQALIKTFLRLEPTLTKIIEDASVLLDQLKPENINAFADSLKQLIIFGKGIATVFGFIAKIFNAIGTAIGEIAGAIATFDFKHFSELTKDVLAFASGPTGFLMRKLTSSGKVTQQSRVDVGVNVGLDKELKQTSPVAVMSNNVRRADVGMATGG